MAKIVNPNAAGIDIASTVHYVAVPEEKCKENVRSFKSFTCDLHKLANWLIECEVDTVAMESTGVYWYHLYTILLDYNIEVYLVNAYHVRNVPGRKSDVSDAQWLQELHSGGYLKACFQPDNLTRALRNYVRQRKILIQEMTTETQRMQKAMVQMNIKLHDVISDIHGVTGTNILNAILAGERDAKKLAELSNDQIKASKETLIKSLEGNWREEQLFNLKMAYKKFKFIQSLLLDCDHECEKIVVQLADDSISEKKLKPLTYAKNQPAFNVRQHLYQVYGVDVTNIYGIKQTTALTILSETGPNLKEKFPTLKQFLSWLNVVPDNKISGNKIIYSRMKKKKNNAGQAFREAANTMWRSQNPIGDYLRTKKSKSGSGQALVSTAKKLATIFYKMVTEKVEFDPYILHGNRQEYLQYKAKKLLKTLEKTNLLIAQGEQIRQTVR
jgi:transposase